jgi:hypothetical protein
VQGQGNNDGPSIAAVDLTAAGGVLLAAAVVMIEARMESSWSHGPHFAISIAAFAVLFALALRGPPEPGPRPTAAQSALLASGLVVLVAASIRLGQVAGENRPASHPGTLIWLALVFAALAAYPAVKLGSAVCTLAAAAALGIAATEFADKYLSVDRPHSFRWVFLVLMALYALSAMALRDTRPRHSAQLVNNAMFAVLAILATVGFGYAFADEQDPLPRLSTGWELVVLAAPLAAIAYAIGRRERGPAWTGAVALVLSILVITTPDTILSNKPSLVGWPLVLLGLTAASFAAAFLAARRT